MNDGRQPRWVTGYKQEQAKGNSGADKASKECITLMKVEDFFVGCLVNARMITALG
jgi:hypothetical protein